MKSKRILVLLAIALLGLSASASTPFSANAKTHQNGSTSSLEETYTSISSEDSGQMGYLDPELLDLTGPTRVLIIASNSLPLREIAEHMISSRATLSLEGFYIIRGTMQADKVKQLSDDPRVLAVLKDRKIHYPVSTEFPTIQSLKEAVKLGLEDLTCEGKSFVSKPEPTLREVVNITGARKAWETYDINGTDVTIAIVDTGVDYGAFSLGYWDVMARDSMGFPAAFDADSECIAFTNITLTAYENATGKFIRTEGMDPYIYVPGIPGEVYRFSELTGIPWLWDMNVTGISSQSGNYHFGLMFQYLFGLDIFPVLVVDSTTEGLYDTVYVDLSFDWAWLNLQYDLPFGTWPPEFSFADETPVTPKGWTVAARDFTGDGIYDLSAGSLGYFLDVWAVSPNTDDRGLVLKPTAPDGDYVVFVNDWWGHGTCCASCAAGRDSDNPFAGPGMAPEAKVMGVTALFIGDIIEAELWAAGFDLIPGTEDWKDVSGYGTVYGTWSYTGNHKADIISNSWGWSSWASGLLDLPWYDVLTVLEDALTVPRYLSPDYPGTVIVHAGGNGAAGYGTFTSPGCATLPIGVGAATSLNNTRYIFGFAGGSYDDIISWSARGPTAHGNVKPDVVNIGAFGWTAGPIWYGFGDGSWAFDLFSGTSMATPLTAGASALTIQAYNQTYKSKPTPEAVKVILKSSAEDLGYDAFVQGAGRVDAFAAVELALAASGVTVTSPITWENIRPRIEYSWSMSYAFLGEPLLFKPPAGPISDVGWFAGAVQQASSATAQFTIENPTTQQVTATITPVIHQQIGTALTYSGYTDELPSDWQTWDWLWGNLTVLDLASIPSEAELMVASLTVPYEYFDQDQDYIWDRRWGLCIQDWIDTNHNGIVEIDEVYHLNYGYNTGTSNEARVSFPLSKIKGQPLIFIYQKGILDSVPFNIYISYYKRKSWTWIETPTRVITAQNSSETFTATITVPADTPQGVYEGQIKIDITDPYYKTLTVPVSLQVPTVLSTDNLVYDLTPPSTVELYDPYRVNGYFDWRWRYEAGDWKQWVFDIQDPTIVAAFVSSSWTGTMTDVDMFGISPTGVIIDGAMSSNLYDGCFEWFTRTGTTEEYVVLHTNSLTGLYTILLHNVLFDGTVFPENITGKVELVKLTPKGPLSMITRSGQPASVNFTIATGRTLSNVGMFTYYSPTGLPVEITPSFLPEISAMGSAEFNVTIDVPEDTPEGIYPVYVFLMSNELLTPAYRLINVMVDNTTPTVRIVSPKSEAVHSGNVTIEAYANDPNGVETVEFEIEQASARMTFDDATGHWTAILDTTTLSDGIYTITIIALDKAGNIGSDSVSFTLDTTSPVVTIAYPTNESYISVSTVWVNGTVAELNKGSLLPSINDARFSLAYWDPVTGAFAFSNTSHIPDGSSVMVMVSFTDLAGNSGSELISFTSDTTLPRITITYPTIGSYIRGSTIWMNGTVTELCKGTLEPFINDTRLSLAYWNSLTGDFAFWNNTAIPDGPLSVTVSFTDLAENNVAETVTVTVDNALPIIILVSPAEDSVVSRTVNVTFSFSDENLESATLLLDGKILSDVTDKRFHLWNATQTSDGKRILMLIVIDKAGNSGTFERTVTVDNTLPTAEIRKPTENTHIKGNYGIIIYGYDVNLDVIELYINESLVDSWNVTGIYTYTWDTTNDGTHIIKLLVKDKAGNSISDTVIVIVDNTKPSVSITSPEDGAELFGEVNINFIVIDTNLKLAQLIIDDNILFNVTEGTHSWDTTKVGDGSYIIKLVAYDEAGNTDETSLIITTVNVKREIEATRNLYLGVGIPVGFIIGAIIVYTITRKKP